MVDLDSNPTKLIEVVIGSNVDHTRRADHISVQHVAKYFAIIPRCLRVRFRTASAECHAAQDAGIASVP